MPNITITGGSVCSGGEHRTITTDLGSVTMLNSELTDNPEGFEAVKQDALVVLKHQYRTRRAAGRTHAQALSDLVGFVIRV